MQAPTRNHTDRESWLQARKKQIGASEVAALAGCSPYTTPWEVWATKTGKISDWAGNEATRAGNRFESVILDHAEADLGDLERDIRYIDDHVPLAATLDGQSRADCKPVEAKTTGLVGPVVGTWGEQDSADVPDHYALQVAAQCICSNTSEGYLYALIAGRGIVRYKLHVPESLKTGIRELVDRWWHTHIIQGIEPELTNTKLDVVKRLHVEEGKFVNLTQTDLIDNWLDAKEQAKTAKAFADSLQAQVLATLGDAERGQLPDGRLITNLETVRQDKAREAKETRFRTLRIKGKKR